MSLNNNVYRAALALSLVLGACGDDGTNTECGAGTMLVNGACVADPGTECGAGTTLTNGECVSDVVCGTGTMNMGGMCVPTSSTTTYRQIEFLGRPGIAEALLITPAFLDGYNATAPSFAGAPAAAVTAIQGEAVTVLKAIFHGTCLINGLLGFDATTGAIPGGVACGAVGGAIFTNNNPLTGDTIVTAQADAATAYATKIAGQFLPDVLRVDTDQATQGYLAGGASLCAGAAAGTPLLCGGRLLNEDVIDITYYYLLAGAAVPTGTTVANTPQVVALVTDGVFFSANNAENSGIGLGTPDPTNTQQFHQSCSNCNTYSVITPTAFPYSARPR